MVKNPSPSGWRKHKNMGLVFHPATLPRFRMRYGIGPGQAWSEKVWHYPGSKYCTLNFSAPQSGKTLEDEKHILHFRLFVTYGIFPGSGIIPCGQDIEQVDNI